MWEIFTVDNITGVLLWEIVISGVLMWEIVISGVLVWEIFTVDNITGVLMWEIFTGGMMPYDQMRNAEVVDFVCSSNKRLHRPDAAPVVVYSIMLECWDIVSL